MFHLFFLAGTLGCTTDRSPIEDERTDSADGDRDGYANHADCNDDDPNIYPGATETWYDGVDSDCSGGSDYDQDGDGSVWDGYGGDDCNDQNAAVRPGASPACETDEDRNCDGVADRYDAACSVPEVCDNGKDDDLDGLTDCEDGDCFGVEACTELCDDGMDNDADGDTDCEDSDCLADCITEGTTWLHNAQVSLSWNKGLFYHATSSHGGGYLASDQRFLGLSANTISGSVQVISEMGTTQCGWTAASTSWTQARGSIYSQFVVRDGPAPTLSSECSLPSDFEVPRPSPLYMTFWDPKVHSQSGGLWYAGQGSTAVGTSGSIGTGYHTYIRFDFSASNATFHWTP